MILRKSYLRKCYNMNCPRCNKKYFTRGIICDCGLDSFTERDAAIHKEDYFIIIEDKKFIYDLSWYENTLTIHKNKHSSPKIKPVIKFNNIPLNISLSALNTLITFS